LLLPGAAFSRTYDKRGHSTMPARFILT
jgi:hypothetical protein